MDQPQQRTVSVTGKASHTFSATVRTWLRNTWRKSRM